MHRIFFHFLLILLVASACTDSFNKEILQKDDYNSYLITDTQPSYQKVTKRIEFLSKRLRNDTSGIGNLGPLASGYEDLFELTGNVAYLKDAETLLKKARDNSRELSENTYARSLAHNYISQHRFKEAAKILEDVKSRPHDEQKTNLMLFDVYMELGRYEEAGKALEKTENESLYAYLTRRAKWSDHLGNHKEGIRYFEKAMKRAEASNQKSNKIWIYSNLADFYGHDGQVEKAYKYYLKTLELDPSNAYAKKGIAWIAYSHEKDVKEANRILDSIMVNRDAPEYHLLKADMAEYEGNQEEHDRQMDVFFAKATKPAYGNMYNTYLVEAYADSDPQKALKLAKEEVQNRATAETYQLLALAQLKTGQKEKALQTIEKHVKGNAHEAKTYVQAAMVYRANEEVKPLKEMRREIRERAFDLGPVEFEKARKI